MASSAGFQACEEPGASDPNVVCGAQAAVAERCLAHLGQEDRGAHLAALSPGSAVHARGVPFTPELVAELLAALRDDQGVVRFGHADFRGASFEGTTEFRGVSFSDGVSFYGAEFRGDARFDGASFAGLAGFGWAVFSGRAHFYGASFADRAGFSRASFAGEAGFDRVRFSGDVGFSEVPFAADASFGEAAFSGNAYFSTASFTGNANFSGASFSEGAYFARVAFSHAAFFGLARFAGPARFTCRADRMDFSGAAVETELRLEAAAREVTAGGLRAQGRVSLRLRGARVDLSDVVCAGPLTVHGLQRPIPEAAGPEPLDPATGRTPAVAVVSLRGVDAESLVLTDVDLSDCRFAGLHRVDQVHLDGRCTFAAGPHSRRRVLAEEHHWRARRREKRGAGPGGWTPAPEGVEVVGPARLEVLYRQLRKAFEDAKNEPGAADFYYGEMEMRRADARRGERFLLWAYWACSGYALRARRALTWLAVAIAIGIVALTAFGFPTTPKEQHATGSMTTPAGRQPIDLTLRLNDPVAPVSARAEKATEITLNAVVFRSPDAELTTPGRYLNLVTRILGPLLLGLSVLAIRNQVKR